MSANDPKRTLTLVLAFAGTKHRAELVEALGQAPGPPNAPISPMIPWTRAFGPSAMRVQKAWARSGTARSTFIWEIPG